MCGIWQQQVQYKADVNDFSEKHTTQSNCLIPFAKPAKKTRGTSILHSNSWYSVKISFVNYILCSFLLPDRVGVNSIIKPQDVQTEQPHDQGMHSGHQPGDKQNTHRLTSSQHDDPDRCFFF